MESKNDEKSLEEINKEIEEELRNYNPEEDADEQKKSKLLFTVPGIIILIIGVGLALYRVLHFFF